MCITSHISKGSWYWFLALVIPQLLPTISVMCLVINSCDHSAIYTCANHPVSLYRFILGHSFACFHGCDPQDDKKKPSLSGFL